MKVSAGRRRCRRSKPLRTGGGWVLALLLSAPGGAEAQRPVPGRDPEFPRIQYADSLVSLNDRCIVSQKKLSTKIRPVYVNGRPIGFC